MKPPAAKGKTTQLRRSRLAHRVSGPSHSYRQTRVRASRLYEAAFILASIELTRRLHQAYRFAYDKQAAEWLLPQNSGQQSGTLAGTVTDPRQDFKNFLQTMSQDCKDALRKIGVLGKLSNLADKAQIYDVNNLQNARASGYVGGLARGRETLGQWFDRSTPLGGAHTAPLRVPHPGIYIRGGESAFAGAPYFKLHEMTHMAYVVGVDLDKSLGRALGLTKGTTESWSDAVDRFFNSQCTKKVP